MKKGVFIGSLLSTIFLVIGTYAFPTDPLMWLAGISVGYTILRAILVLALLAVLFTEPPRRLYMRIIMGSAALMLIGTAVVLSSGNSMHILDIILFMEVGIALAIEALELNAEELQAQANKLQAQYTAMHVRDSAEYFHTAMQQPEVQPRLVTI